MTSVGKASSTSAIVSVMMWGQAEAKRRAAILHAASGKPTTHQERRNGQQSGITQLIKQHGEYEQGQHEERFCEKIRLPSRDGVT